MTIIKVTVVKRCLSLWIYGYWEKFNETLAEKDDFYSYLNMEDITDAGYLYAKIACKDFEINLFEYHYLFVQSDALLLAGVFEKFRNMCIIKFTI